MEQIIPFGRMVYSTWVLAKRNLQKIVSFSIIWRTLPRVSTPVKRRIKTLSILMFALCCISCNRHCHLVSLHGVYRMRNARNCPFFLRTEYSGRFSAVFERDSLRLSVCCASHQTHSGISSILKRNNLFIKEEFDSE